jgi:DNA polymerase
MWWHILAPRYGWPMPKFEQWRCTMVAALATGFPGKLEHAAPAVGLDIAKDKQGAALMMRMARPRSQNDDGSYVWWDESDRIERLAEYCIQDVKVERAIHQRLVPLTASEQQLYYLDQEINDRGVYINKEFCQAAEKIIADATERLNAEMGRATGGAVASCSNVGNLLTFCQESGLDVESMRKADVTALLARNDLADAVREALELRRAAAKAGVKKIHAAIEGTSADGRARGLFFFNGATTGRWAGRRIQLQNLQRPDKGTDDDNLLDDILTGSAERVEMLYGSPLAAIGNAIRGIVCAAPGHKLIAADLANIESRVLSWLAGEQWKLDTFSAYDVGAGPDIYVTGYSRSFGVDPSSVDGTQRLIGKVQELALGYQGGVGAFQTMSRTYGVNIGQSYDMLTAASPQFAERAEAAFADRGKASGIPERDWVAAEIVKLSWRDANPRIVQLWADLEAAAIQALDKPNDIVQCGKVNFLKRGSFLWVQLPSGRPLCYPYPRLSEKEMPWLDKKTGKPARKLTFTFKTEVNRSWVDSYAYGGLWAENVTQAAARDILADALKRLDAAGYPPVLHAHDEAVAEVPLGYGSVEEFCQIMSEVPHWASGCPISAAGWSGARYRKG